MSQIKITGLTVYTTSIPAKAVHSHGIGDVGNVESVILKLDTDAGITGWGEGSPWAVFTGTTQANAAALHVHLRPMLMGADPFRIEELLAGADQRIVHCTEAKAAMETALLDIVGQALGVPVCDLLGGACRDELPLSFSVANPNFDEDLELVQELYGDGIRILKVKTGFAGHAKDLERLEGLRTTLPADMDIRVDYNQGMTVYDAIPKLRDVEAFYPTFIEQPIPADKIEAMVAITHALDTPILADETVFNPRDALTAAKLGAANLFSIKIMKSGGLLRGKEVAAIGRAAGIACYGGCMFETGIAHMAGTHLVAACPNISMGCEFYMATYYLQEDILAEPFPVKNGKVIVPTKPGLGIQVDEDKLAKYTVERLG